MPDWICGNDLQGIAKEKRPGGTITLPELIETLWQHVVLRDYPNHEAAWRTMDGCRKRIEPQSAKLWVRIFISLSRATDRTREDSRDNPVVALRRLRRGKSSLVATFVGQPGRYRRVVWLRERQVDFPGQHELAGHFTSRIGYRS